MTDSGTVGMANLLSTIMSYEQGDLDDETTIDLFRFLVDTGMAWKLQGHYGRTAAAMIEDGVISPPSPFQVVAGNLATGEEPRP